MSTSLLSALKWAVSANAIANLTNLAGLIIFARILGTEVVGAYAATIVAVELVALVLSFGFNQAVIRFRDDQKIFSAALTLVLAQCAVLTLIISVAVWASSASGLNVLQAGWPVVFVVSAKLLTILTTLSYAPFEGKLHYKPIAIGRSSSALIALMVSVAFAYLSDRSDLVIPLRDLTAAVLMYFLIAKRLTFKLRPTGDRMILRKVWQFTRPIWHLNVLEKFAIRADYAIVSLILDQSTFGVYYQVRALVEGALGFVLSPIQTVIYAYYCRLNNALEAYKEVIRKWRYPVVAGTMAVVLVFAVSAVDDWLVALLYGRSWASGGTLLAGLFVFAVSMIFFEHAKVVSIALSIRRPPIVGRLLQAGLIVGLVGPATVYYGLLGASVATGFAAAILSLVTNILLHSEKADERRG